MSGRGSHPRASGHRDDPGGRAPDFALLVDGEDRTASLRGRLISCSVREDLELLGWFELCLAGTRAAGGWMEEFPPGSRVEVSLGRVGSLSRVITGAVTGASVERDGPGGSSLCIRGLDPLHRLGRGERTRAFRDVRWSDVVTEVARQWGIPAEVVETPSVLPHLLQANETDLALLRRLAGAAGYEVFWRDDRLLFRPPAQGEAVGVTLEGDRNIVSARVDLSLVGQCGAVEVRGWDPVRKEALVGRAGRKEVLLPMGGELSGPEMSDRSFSPSVQTFPDEGVRSQEEADLTARRLMGRIALETIRGELETVGDSSLRSGRFVAVKGVDPGFDGTFYVTGVDHILEPHRGYLCRLRLRRNAAGRVESGVEPPRGRSSSEPAARPPPPEIPVEIRCLDPAGEPMAGERYLLTLPDGRRMEGVTDGRGSIPWPEEAGSGAVTVEIPSMRFSPPSEGVG